jgi:hypothetical protein
MGATERIDLERLGQQVRERYGLPVAQLEIGPAGSQAVAVVADGRHFVRAEPAADLEADLEAALAVPAALRHEGGMQQAVAPYRTRSGRLTFLHGPYTVAVFPYISGRPARATESDAAAALLAQLHRSRLFLPALRRVTFGHRLSQSVRRVLRSPGRRESAYAEETRRLLREERGRIEAALATMRRLTAAARTLPLRWAVTHGAPEPGNFLVDASGRLHLIDWGAAALGPVERDLWHLEGPGFAAAVRGYAEETGWGREIRPEVLTLYVHRDWLGRVVRSAETLLCGPCDPAADERAWAALRRCLPLEPGGLEARCRRMADAVAAL